MKSIHALGVSVAGILIAVGVSSTSPQVHAAFPGAPADAAHQGFGVITTTAIPMRQIQLGLKYSF